MKSMACTVVATVALVTSVESYAKSAQEILDAAWEAQVGRWEGLDSYLVEEVVMGRKSKQYFVRAALVNSSGEEREMFVPAPDAALEPGCVNTSSLSAAAENGDNPADYLSWFQDKAELVGEESIDGTEAWQLRANDIDQPRSMDNEEFTMNSMTMWLSKDEYLPLKMRIDGEADMRGQSRQVMIESLHSDFRTVPGTQLREPYRRLMNISGMLDGGDMEQVAQAQEQMAEMEKQMASMPAEQREMMEKMMGPQLETIRKLAETGGIETEIVVESITPNPEAHGERVVACEEG